jgi:hypothetical protein
MAITDISVTDIADFADGHEFGAAGAYVRIKGIARGMLDPAAAANAGIVDLDKAPVNARGLVDYATDFDILRPKDPQRGSSILVYDVPNRGSKRIFNLLDDIPANDPARTNDPKTRGGCRARLLPRARLFAGLVGMGSGRAARQFGARRRVPRRARRWQANRPAHPRRIPFRHPHGRRRQPAPPLLPRRLDRSAGAAHGARPRERPHAPKSRATSGSSSTTARSG